MRVACTLQCLSAESITKTWADIRNQDSSESKSQGDLRVEELENEFHTSDNSQRLMVEVGKVPNEIIDEVDVAMKNLEKKPTTEWTEKDKVWDAYDMMYNVYSTIFNIILHTCTCI